MSEVIDEKPYQAIKSITIKDFKSIADLTLDLGKVNVLIGENGAGKSNILEAIGVLSAAASGRMDYARLKDRGVRLSAPEVFKAALKGRPRKNRFVLDAHFSEGLEYHVSVSPERDDEGDILRYWTENLITNGREKISRGTRGMKILDVSYEKPHYNQGILSLAFAEEEAANIKNDYIKNVTILEKYVIYAPSTPILRNISNDESKISPLGLYGGNLAEALIYLFNHHTAPLSTIQKSMTKLLPWMNTYGFNKPSSILTSHHVHTGKHVVSIYDKRMSKKFENLLAYDVSEGALYVLFLLMLILHPTTPPFFAVDNMDAALNPRLADALLTEAIKLIKEQPTKQIILTTHNPAMLNALDLFDDDIRLYIVERSDEDGSTIARRINLATNMTRDQYNEAVNGVPLSTLWESGALGGLPQIFPRS